MIVRSVILFTFVVGLSGTVLSQGISNIGNSDENKIETTITYCNLKLSPSWKLANLSFNSLYSFNVSDKGDVLEVEKTRDDFIGEEPVKECLSGWKIKGFPNGSRFSVYFTWKHGAGWTTQEISGNGFSQTMKMEGVGLVKLIPGVKE
jgi:hypothetical protein